MHFTYALRVLNFTWLASSNHHSSPLVLTLTIFPNFNVQLRDPTLPNKFKVQVQLVGAPQDEVALSATLHHQIVYRIQDHCFDLPGEKQFEGNALMVLAAED